ncbi:MAG: cell division protein ZapA [Rikenellaceae bacterium]
MAKQAIKLRIAGKTYSFTIDSEKEEVYRLAEREVNSSAAEFEKQKFDGFAMQDYLAMTALKFAITNISNKMQGDVDSDDVKALKSLNDKLAAYIDDPTI